MQPINPMEIFYDHPFVKERVWQQLVLNHWPHIRRVMLYGDLVTAVNKHFMADTHVVSRSQAAIQLAPMLTSHDTESFRQALHAAIVERVKAHFEEGHDGSTAGRQREA